MNLYINFKMQFCYYAVRWFGFRWQTTSFAFLKGTSNYFFLTFRYAAGFHIDTTLDDYNHAGSTLEQKNSLFHRIYLS